MEGQSPDQGDKGDKGDKKSQEEPSKKPRKPKRPTRIRPQPLDPSNPTKSGNTPPKSGTLGITIKIQQPGVAGITKGGPLFVEPQPPASSGITRKGPKPVAAQPPKSATKRVTVIAEPQQAGPSGVRKSPRFPESEAAAATPPPDPSPRLQGSATKVKIKPPIPPKPVPDIPDKLKVIGKIIKSDAAAAKRIQRTSTHSSKKGRAGPSTSAASPTPDEFGATIDKKFAKVALHTVMEEFDDNMKTTKKTKPESIRKVAQTLKISVKDVRKIVRKGEAKRESQAASAAVPTTPNADDGNNANQPADNGNNANQPADDQQEIVHDEQEEERGEPEGAESD